MPPWKARRSASAGNRPRYMVKLPARKARKAKQRRATVVDPSPIPAAIVGSGASRRRERHRFTMLLGTFRQTRQPTVAVGGTHQLHTQTPTHRRTGNPARNVGSKKPRKMKKVPPCVVTHAKPKAQ